MFLPLKAVVITLLKSSLTKLPSLQVKDEGIIVQPRRAPVNPAYLEKELTSIATSFAPSISYVDLGTPSDLMNGAQAASNTNAEPRSLHVLTRSVNCSLVAAAPVGLLGLQKYTTSARGKAE